MRIQETDRILKDAKIARHQIHTAGESNVLSRAWKTLTSMFKK